MQPARHLKFRGCNPFDRALSSHCPTCLEKGTPNERGDLIAEVTAMIHRISTAGLLSMLGLSTCKVMNEFDITECTGPFDCENFKRFGYTVGCENWVEGSAANFPHQKWLLA